MGAHRGMIEVNNLHFLKGFVPPHLALGADFDWKKHVAIPIGSHCPAWTGAKDPYGNEVQFSPGSPGLTLGAAKLPSGCSFMCCIIGPLFCTNVEKPCGCGACLPHCGCLTGCCSSLAAVDPCCCKGGCRTFHDALEMPPPGAKSFNGHDLTYYEDAKYLKWPYFGSDAAREEGIQPFPGCFPAAPSQEAMA